MNNFLKESRCFSSRKGQTTEKNSFFVNEIRRTLKNIRSCIVLKDGIAKNFVATEHHSFTFVFIYIQCRRRRRPTDRLHLKFPFSRRNRRSRSSLFPVNRRRRRELRRGS